MTALSRGAAIAAIAASAACSPLRALGHIGRACIDVPAGGDDGEIAYGAMRVRTVDAPVGYALVLANAGAREAVDRVVYVVPGRGGTARDVVTTLGFAAVARALVRGGFPPFALLAIDSGSSYFHPRASGEDRLAILERDLPALARHLIGTGIRSESIVGMSMGGYGALLAAERNPRRYRAVAVAAPALFQSYDEENHAVGDAFDSAAQFARYDVLSNARLLAGTPVLVRVGYDDPFLANVEVFARVCPHADVGYVEHGCHDDGFWRLTARDCLAFALRGRAG